MGCINSFNIHVCSAQLFTQRRDRLDWYHFLLQFGDSAQEPKQSRSADFTVGEKEKKTTGNKSKIPVASPDNHGVNIEDFRLSIIRGSVESTQKFIEQGRSLKKLPI